MATDPRPQEVTIVPVTDEGGLFQALAIREIVFIEEQHIPAGIERDAEDSHAYHVLAIQGGHAIGTGRLVMLSAPPQGEAGSWAQIGRMAVLQANRKGGTGTRVLRALEEEALRRGISGIVLNAQLYALDFYKKHGYQPIGATFEEGGMPHLPMIKKFSKSTEA
jgi:predicted GNAT family N-acyltransferase